MASNTPQTPKQQEVHEVEKSSSAKPENIQPNHNPLTQQQKLLLGRFWNVQRQQITGTNHHDLKKHEFPLSRIKKIMKADEDVQMVAAECPILLSKACEFFIQELTIRAWLHAERAKRQTLSEDHIVEAINETDYYNFLFDFRHDHKQVVAGGSSSSHADSVVSEDGVMPPPVQRWIRYGNETEMNGGEQKGDVDGAAK